jgi:hypothetical protein
MIQIISYDTFQMQILLKSHGILGFVDGSTKCPSRFDADSDLEGVETNDHQVWKKHDRALMQLLIATLSSTAISYVLGCVSSHNMWQYLCYFPCFQSSIPFQNEASPY